MNAPGRLATLAVLAVFGALLSAGSSAPAQTAYPAATSITASGVGGVKLGKTFGTLYDAHLIGPLKPGCELGGPNTRSAQLRLPLRGSVDFTLTRPRKATNITIMRGATARGVGSGATIAQIKAAFPKAIVDHGTEQVFQTTSVRIPKSGGGRIEFAVDIHTNKTILIGVPFIAACE
jgi:hypothetical protein